MFSITSKDLSSRARTGLIHTPHGEIETPAYVIVGTHAEVRTLTPEDLKHTQTQAVITNAYHLRENPRDVHDMLGWQGPIMTDSGGFQVFSLGFGREHNIGKVVSIFPEHNAKEFHEPEKNLVRITDEGAYFLAPKSAEGTTEKGEQFLGPKESMQIQHKLGADIIFAFDECTSPLHDYEYTKKSLARTHAWEKICLDLQLTTYNFQLLYGIVQGGEFRDLREESAKYIGSMPFDGFAIGGSLGRSRSQAFDILDWTIPLLPETKPRHFLGIGKIEDLFDGVRAGIDTFDCVIPTREARHGRLWGKRGYFDIIKSIWKDDASPIEEGCACPTCEALTKKELHERFRAKDKSAARYATIHNVFFFNNLMKQIRVAIQENAFQKLKKQYLAIRN
ncbi:MAG: tRNA guanosine(34) transglycosylase Tgt [Nanoarchaeota archaeon]|nr:tRNA guanosine(34) transglycosylase Tgt [Nanoarchaeota archaeon]